MIAHFLQCRYKAVGNYYSAIKIIYNSLHEDYFSESVGTICFYTNGISQTLQCLKAVYCLTFGCGR